MGKLFLFFIIFIFSSCASTNSFHKPLVTQASQQDKMCYIVKRGDSLWRISKRYGTTPEALMRMNRISSPDNLKIGQKILVPSSGRGTSGNFTWPLSGEVINFFGESIDSTVNRGLNIQTGFSSKEVKAAAKGKVVFANQLKGWGHTVILEHGGDFYTIYANLEPSLVKEGVVIQKAQVIGQAASGKNGSHILHFEIRKRYVPQDPLRYLN